MFDFHVHEEDLGLAGSWNQRSDTELSMNTTTQAASYTTKLHCIESRTDIQQWHHLDGKSCINTPRAM